MVVRSPSLNKVLLVSLLLMLFNSSNIFSIEKEIGDVINQYARVTTISGVDRVVVNNFSGFAAGDTVLIIQMQGVEILTDDGSYGNIQNKLGTPGGYEFLIVESVNLVPNEIVFKNDILGSYDIRGSVQLVRVPYYTNATVKNVLTALPWDDPSNPNTGGVLALIVGRNLTLNADIDVSGKGFKGGSDTTGTGICISTDLLLYNKASYSRVSPNAGYKGEGIAVHDEVGALLDPLHVLGLGPNYSGGGGGNGYFSGGGGGSNRGLGGLGGFEKLGTGLCATPRRGGLGGLSINASAVLTSGIFQGGGGGSSTYAAGSAATPGGRGGGIVIIVTDKIIGNGKSIKANGADAGNALSNGGAGGGGAGGSVILSLQNYSSQLLSLSANGGKGGNGSGFGGGGGGGGGFIWVSTALASIPANVTRTTTGGAAGTTASAGTSGELRESFKAVLNGFLFNSVSSSITGNLIDSICSNVVPKELIGTTPVGGSSPYTYVWERSTDDITFLPVASSNTQNYIPSLLEPSTVYFRRKVTDAAASPITDISKSVKIIVQQAITGNTIGKDTIICYNQDPLPVGQLATSSLGAGNGHYTYLWRNTTTNTDAPGLNTLAGYDSPQLTQTTYYARIVTSGRCVDTSTPVMIKVLPVIGSNTITTPLQTVCYGDLFTNIGASAPSGGDNIYSYKWIQSSNNNVWTDAPGTITSQGYDPAETSSVFPGKEYYRRVVYSGLHSACRDTTTFVLLTMHPAITNNIVSGTQLSCSGTDPLLLSGSQPLNGDGVTYNYIWQDSSKLHNWLPVSGTAGQNFQPSALIDTTWFRRIVLSSACDDTSNLVVVKVHKPILNNIINLISLQSDTTVCSGAVPNKFKGKSSSGGSGIPGDYAYQWFSSVDNVTFNPVPDAAGTSLDYRPGSLTATTYFKRKTISGQCTDISSAIKVTVLPLISNNTISTSQKICINTSPDLLSGSVPTGGGGAGSYTFLWEQSADGVAWSAAAGNNTVGSYQPPALSIPMKYRRKVTSGTNNCCFNNMINETEWVSITLWQDIDSIYAGADKLFFTFEYVDTLNALEPTLGTGVWSSVPGNGLPSFDDDSKYNTVVRNLSLGQNVLEWTVSNGTCVKKDQITIEVLDLLVPEGFSPNGDGINEEFEILGLDTGNNSAELTIINAYGSQVFKDVDYQGRWDGYDCSGNKLPDGTYYYLLTINSDRIDKSVKKSGFIILKR